MLVGPRQRPTIFPYTTLFRSVEAQISLCARFDGSQRLGWLRLFFALSLVHFLILHLCTRVTRKNKMNYEDQTNTHRAPLWERTSLGHHNRHLASTGPQRVWQS